MSLGRESARIEVVLREGSGSWSHGALVELAEAVGDLVFTVTLTGEAVTGSAKESLSAALDVLDRHQDTFSTATTAAAGRMILEGEHRAVAEDPVTAVLESQLRRRGVDALGYLQVASVLVPLLSLATVVAGFVMVFITGSGPGGVTTYPYRGTGIAMMAGALLLWLVAAAVVSSARLQALRTLTFIRRGANKPVS